MMRKESIFVAILVLSLFSFVILVSAYTIQDFANSISQLFPSTQNNATTGGFDFVQWAQNLFQPLASCSCSSHTCSPGCTDSGTYCANPSDCQPPICGDRVCTPNLEDCGTCLPDCPCPTGYTCSGHQCQAPTRCCNSQGDLCSSCSQMGCSPCNSGVSCTSGQTKSCTTSQNCPGTQTCSNGNWGSCVDNSGDNCPSTGSNCPQGCTCRTGNICYTGETKNGQCSSSQVCCCSGGTTSVCNPQTQPSPDWGEKGGKCLPSCGKAGGPNAKCQSEPCTTGQSDPPNYQCTHCCVASSEIQSCTELDGGNVPTVFSTCTDYKGTYSDRCDGTQGYMTEFYCSNTGPTGLCQSTAINCNGYCVGRGYGSGTCSGGACQCQTGTTNPGINPCDPTCGTGAPTQGCSGTAVSGRMCYSGEFYCGKTNWCYASKDECINDCGGTTQCKTSGDCTASSECCNGYLCVNSRCVQQVSCAASGGTCRDSQTSCSSFCGANRQSEFKTGYDCTNGCCFCYSMVQCTNQTEAGDCAGYNSDCVAGACNDQGICYGNPQSKIGSSCTSSDGSHGTCDSSGKCVVQTNTCSKLFYGGTCPSDCTGTCYCLCYEDVEKNINPGDTCCPCGGEGQRCCSSGTCNADLTCQNEKCQKQVSQTQTCKEAGGECRVENCQTNEEPSQGSCPQEKDITKVCCKPSPVSVGEAKVGLPLTAKVNTPVSEVLWIIAGAPVSNGIYVDDNPSSTSIVPKNAGTVTIIAFLFGDQMKVSVQKITIS
jgi:hypothetical protein